MEQTIELLNLLKWTTQIEFNNLDRVLKRNEVELQKNIYFVAWLKEKMFKRCNDDDIFLKKYFVVDIDIRLDCYKQTWIVLDNTQLMEHMANLLELIQDAWLDDYSAIVHSWNGLHLYYVWNERSFDKDVYSNWVRSIYEVINNAIKSTWYKCDPACHNISRIMRLPWTINPRKKEILNKETKEKELAYDLWDFTCYIIDINPKVSKLFESIEEYANKYQEELEKEKADAVVVHKILKKDYKKSDDIWEEINRIPACDVACDIRPVTTSDKWKDNVALKESDKNMWAYWYRPTNVIVNTWSSMIKTNKSYFTSYELIFYEYANQDAKKTLEYFEKWWVKIHEKNWIIIPKKDFLVQWYEYPWEAFNEFDCVMSWELMVIVALSNSWKTTYCMDMIQTNASKWKKCFYINLEFPIETMWRSRWLFLNDKTKRNLTDLDPLSQQEKEQMDEYVSKQLVKFDSYSNPKWIELEELVEMIIEKNKEWYGFFAVDTFSRIKWNLDSAKAHTTQNKCMEVLQDLCQSLWVVVVLLHHTNKAWWFEWSQKIMDLANVFLMMARDEDMFWERITKFSLTKDKFVSYKEIETVYKHWEYIKSLPN